MSDEQKTEQEKADEVERIFEEGGVPEADDTDTVIVVAPLRNGPARPAAGEGDEA